MTDATEADITIDEMLDQVLYLFYREEIEGKGGLKGTKDIIDQCSVRGWKSSYVKPILDSLQQRSMIREHEHKANDWNLREHDLAFEGIKYVQDQLKIENSNISIFRSNLEADISLAEKATKESSSNGSSEARFVGASTAEADFRSEGRSTVTFTGDISTESEHEVVTDVGEDVVTEANEQVYAGGALRDADGEPFVLGQSRLGPIPASDRIISLTDNQEQRNEIVELTKELIEQVRASNQTNVEVITKLAFIDDLKTSVERLSKPEITPYVANVFITILTSEYWTLFRPEIVELVHTIRLKAEILFTALGILF